MILAKSLATIAIFTLTTASAYAIADVTPGKSVGVMTLGTKRSDAISAIQNRLKEIGLKYKVSHSKVHGIMDDMWDVGIGDNKMTFEALSKNGKVVQLEETNAREGSITDLTFGQLTKRHNLRKLVFGFDSPDGGGWDEFYFDDKRRGICFALGSQDQFLLTFRPDTVIVHPVGSSVIPLSGGIWGKVVTGEAAKTYNNVDDARRAERKQQNDY